ncbi:DUF6397 family protein [Streptomyces sp. NPDC002845]
MSGHTITQSTTTLTPTSASATAGTDRPSLAQSRAARELGLKRGEFDLAVQLGCVRTIADDGEGGRRVTREEIGRVRSESGFPEALRERVRTVGTTEGAALIDVTGARFTRLARLGLVVPAKWYLNRYRAVVWLYLADELRQFAADEKNTPLLRGRVPEALRRQLDAGLDLRPRNWRGRHLGFLLRQAEDPWVRAAAVASLLDPVQVAEIVRDPYERAYLNRFRPERPAHGAPESPAAQIAARITTADDPDEIGWLRADLRQTVADARGHRAAPRPEQEPSVPGSGLATVGKPQPPPTPTGRPERTASDSGAHPGHLPSPGQEPEKPRGLLGWLRRRKP